MKSFVSLLLLLPFADALGSAFCGRIANTNNGSIDLSCQDTGAVIASIDFASYGTPTGACGSFKAGACESKTSMSVVNGTCFNKASCKIVRLTCNYRQKLIRERSCHTMFHRCHGQTFLAILVKARSSTSTYRLVAQVEQALPSTADLLRHRQGLPLPLGLSLDQKPVR
jgi:hypothetical protein